MCGGIQKWKLKNKSLRILTLDSYPSVSSAFATNPTLNEHLHISAKPVQFQSYTIKPYFFVLSALQYICVLISCAVII